MNLERRSINEIKPYWRNPRITEGAVEAVKASITAYGFNQPLILDKDGVIIAGHVRFKALQELGFKEVECVVVDISEQLAKQYRIADNKTSELAKWDVDKLMQELREIAEIGAMQQYFPESDLEAMMSGAMIGAYTPVNGADIERRQEVLQGQMAARSSETTGAYVRVTCPECGHEYHINKNELDKERGDDSPEVMQ